MESRNIKVTDDHGIDRTANVVARITVDGSDYVIYWIERDAENDNLFVSKLVKNIDGTFNMINIEDSMEKNKLTEIVKELITKSVSDENDNLGSDTVVLDGGKNVLVSTVLFNKEQNINVQKTYVTTVKKTVTKVSEDYYHVVKTEAPIAQENVSVPEPEKVADAVETPKIEVGAAVSELDNLVIPPFDDSFFAVLPDKEVKSVPIEAEVISPVSEIDIPGAPMPSVPEPPVPVENKIEPEEPKTVLSVTPNTPEIVVQPVAETVQPVAKEVEPVVPQDVPVVEPVINAEPVPAISEVTEVAQPIIDTPEVLPVSEPVAKTEPVINTPVEEPKTTVSEPTESVLFDASKETNLKEAFDEATAEAPITVDAVNSIREFGQDEPVKEAPVNNDINNSATSGFANHKFLMILVVAFFIGACIFLGYELFNYLQVK